MFKVVTVGLGIHIHESYSREKKVIQVQITVD